MFKDFALGAVVGAALVGVGYAIDRALFESRVEQAKKDMDALDKSLAAIGKALDPKDIDITVVPMASK